ncbi:MAG TPA: hypothetical protein VJ735_09335 [Actinomycetes bacterium]|nr:hypothetical protein [Actinomycetes bacterium]
MDAPEVLVGEGIELCGRCAAELGPNDRIELCVWCEGPLCWECWEVPGHCGHAEWELINRAIQRAMNSGQRAKLMATPGPIGHAKAARFRFN